MKLELGETKSTCNLKQIGVDRVLSGGAFLQKNEDGTQGGTWDAYNTPKWKTSWRKLESDMALLWLAIRGSTTGVAHFFKVKFAIFFGQTFRKEKERYVDSVG